MLLFVSTVFFYRNCKELNTKTQPISITESVIDLNFLPAFMYKADTSYRLHPVIQNSTDQILLALDLIIAHSMWYQGGFLEPFPPSVAGLEQPWRRCFGRTRATCPPLSRRS